MPDPLTEAINQNPASCLKLDENASWMDLTDGINERLGKASAIVGMLTSNDNFKLMNDDMVSNALWTIGSLVDEIQAMGSRSHELHSKEVNLEHGPGRADARSCLFNQKREDDADMNRETANNLNPFIGIRSCDTQDLAIYGLMALEDFDFNDLVPPSRDSLNGYSLLLLSIRRALEYERDQSDSDRVSETGNQG